MSFSKNVIRGLHLQTKKSQGKYITAIKGKIYDTVVDLRKFNNLWKKIFNCFKTKCKITFIPPDLLMVLYFRLKII